MNRLLIILAGVGWVVLFGGLAVIIAVFARGLA